MIPPYTLQMAAAASGSVPRFRVIGTGDLPALAARCGLLWDARAGEVPLPTPYHARMLWCYAEPTAQAALARLFPGYPMPQVPVWPPLLLAARDRLIFLSTPADGHRAKAAGFLWHDSWRYWWTQDIRQGLALLDLAEPELQRRLSAVQSLPFAHLATVNITDLIRLPPPESGGGAAGAAGPEEDGTRPVLAFEPTSGIFSCDGAQAGAAGFQRSGSRWITRDFEIAQKMRAFADPLAELRMQAEAMVRTVPSPFLEDPRPVAVNPNAPGPFGPDQYDGIDFITTRRAAIVADEMGVGKTAQAYGAINRERPDRVLVFAPAKLCSNWAKEARLWLAPPMTAAILRPGKAATLPDATVTIVSKDAAHRLLPLLTSVTWDRLIDDEAHEEKNESSRRGKTFFEHLAPQAKRLLFLTGTPIWNRPQDLWAILHACAPVVFPNKDAFLKLYRVNDPENISDSLAQRLDFLARLMKSGLMIRRLKDNVLDLPPKTHSVVNVPLDPAQLRALQSHDASVKDLQGSSERSPERQRTILSEMARLRRSAGQAKYRYVLERLVDFVQGTGRPPLVLGMHRDLLRQLAEDLAAAGTPMTLLTGHVTAANRQKLVDRFQDGETAGAIASYDAAGVGYTLIRSADVFVYEMEVTPAKVRQGVDRAHRRGQTQEVGVTYFVVEGTIDAHIARLAAAKEQVSQAALGDHLLGSFASAELLLHAVFAADAPALAA